MLYRSSFVRRRRRAVALLVPSLLVPAIIVLAGALLQTRVVPRITNRLESRLAAACACEVTLRGPRYRPLSGRFVLEEVELALPSGAARLVAGPVHVRTPLSYLRGAAGALRSGIDLLPAGTGRLRAALTPDVALERLARTTAGVAERGLLPPRVDVGVTTLSLSAVPQPLRVDGLAIVHDAEAKALRLEAPRRLAEIPPGTIPLSFGAELDYGRPRLAANVAVAPVEIPGADGARPLSGIVAGSVAVALGGERSFDLSGRVDLSSLTLRSPVVASEPVGPIDLSYRFDAVVDPQQPNAPDITAPAAALSHFPPVGRLTFTSGELTVNGISMEVVPELIGIGRLRPGSADELVDGLLTRPRRLRVELDLPATELQRIHRALPPALRGDLDPMRLEGTLAWSLSLLVPLESIGEMTWEARTELDGFRVDRIPEAVSPFRLNDRFVHVIRDPAIGYERAVEIPPAALPPEEWSVEHSEHAPRFVAAWRAREADQAGAIATNPPRVLPSGRTPPDPDDDYRYVRLDEMSPWVVRAVLTAEDGDFFFHDGVNFHTLPRALERNLRAGEIQFGASTISMQLVKMLFLDADRLVSRKLQEVFLVFLMEHEVPVAKERILEIYLNVVEFGPGVFGIADAARYYFDKDPAELDAGEATWLASVLPSPKRFHHYFEDGAITAGWFARMRAYYNVMLERGRMTPEEYADAIAAPPQFARREEDPVS